MSSNSIIVRRPLTLDTPAYHLVIGVTLLLLALLLAAAPLRLASVALVAVALGILILIRPALGLVAVALAIPFGGFVQVPGLAFNGVDVLVALTIAGWLARGIADRRIVFRRPPLTWSLLIFVWCAALSLTQATSWREGLPEWFKWTEFATLYLVATQVLNRRSATWTLVALFAAGALEFALGAYQFAFQAGPEAFIIQGRFLRAYGTFSQPNPYAGYLGYLFPVAASLMVSAFDRWRRERKPIHLALAAACGILAGALLLGIVMSWSRGAWLGVVAGGFVVIALRGRRSATLAISAVLVLTLLVAAFGTRWMPGIISARISDLGSFVTGPDPARTEITDANFAVLERLAHWQAGQQMFTDHPWLGVGIGNYGAVYANYAVAHWYLPLGHAHNVYLNFLAEIGVVGFAAFMFFWLGVAWLSWRAATNPDRYASALGIGILGAWAFLSVHSLFDNLFVQHMQLQLALLLGILVALIGSTGAAAGVAHSKTRPAA
jgi:putative inorganic carbon (hco3(-)) transporter